MDIRQLYNSDSKNTIIPNEDIELIVSMIKSNNDFEKESIMNVLLMKHGIHKAISFDEFLDILED